jgi:16S rRNA (guanine1207-N2)-methyltransferase
VTSGQYFDATPGSPSRPRQVTLTLPDLTVDLASDSGVFSADRIDPGTKYLLLEAPLPPKTGTLADLGCGYGAIAIALARRSPAATIHAIDVNDRARDLCAANSVELDCPNIIVGPPEGPAAAASFDAIYSNPPIRIGKSALHDFLDTWLPRLSPDGWAILVVQKHLGSDSLAAWLSSQGWSVERLGSRQGYRLLRVARVRDPEST